jgi:hypothetical protein
LTANGTRISVALCTYNGARFLPAQLASILAQVRMPDELIWCDDVSNDDTMLLAEEFCKAAPFPVRVVQNATNVGSNRNFQQAIELCTGDLIALTDQDDIWEPHRLERSEAELRNRPDCGLVFSDGTIIDDSGNPTGSTLWQSFLFTPELQKKVSRGTYTPLARFRFVTGATVTFCAKYRPYLFPILGDWIHDSWLAMVIACLSGVCLVREPLVQYRQHASQQVGLRQRSLRQPRSLKERSARHWASVDGHRVILGDVIAAMDRMPIDRTRGAAADIIRQHDFLRRRLALPASRVERLLCAHDLRREYHMGANGWWSVVKDMVLNKCDDEAGAAARSGFSPFSKPKPGVC